MTNEEKVAYETAHLLQHVMRVVDSQMPAVLEIAGMQVSDEKLLHKMKQGFVEGMLEEMLILSKLTAEQWDKMLTTDIDKEFGINGTE